MDKTKLELIVGLFVLIGIVCLGYLAIKLGKLEVVGGDRSRSRGSIQLGVRAETRCDGRKLPA